MVFLILGFIGVLFIATTMTVFSVSMDTGYSGAPFQGFSVEFALLYIILLVLWFFLLMYLFRFANRMRVALHGYDQQALNNAFQNLKISFRCVGIVTIIVLAFYSIAKTFGIIAAAAFS